MVVRITMLFSQPLGGTARGSTTSSDAGRVRRADGGGGTGRPVRSGPEIGQVTELAVTGRAERRRPHQPGAERNATAPEFGIRLKRRMRQLARRQAGL